MNDADTLVKRGTDLLSGGDLRGAKRQFLEALEKDRKHVKAIRTLSEISWFSRDYQKAVDYLTQAYEIAPDDRDIVLHLCHRLTEIGQDALSRQVIQTHLQRHPDDRSLQKKWHEIELSLARVERRTLQPERARKLLTLNRGNGNGNGALLKPMSYEEYLELEANFPTYYVGRWVYFREVIDILNRLPFENVLELGPYRRPMVRGSDTMDLDKHIPGMTYYHNGADTPWPVEDKKYDLFVGMQVWEHLDDRQQEAFNEARRISKRALLSFPLRWNCPDDPVHHNITEERIAEWTHHLRPVLTVKVSARLIALFDFSPETA